MTPASAIVLHGAAAFEITLLEYLLRVVIYLAAFGGVAVIAFWGFDLVEETRSVIGERWDVGWDDP